MSKEQDSATLAPQHEGLSHIDNVPETEEGDRECLKELKQVLKKHGKERRFGAFLLHNHFPVYNGEVLVETCDEQRRTLTIQPAPISNFDPAQLTQTQFRLDVPEPMSMLGCVQVCRNDGARHVGAEHNQTG